MTREEAIEQLNFMIETTPKQPPEGCDYIDEWWKGHDDMLTAFDMAIKALEQAPDIEKVIDTINFEEKWLLDAGYSCSNVNTAFRSIKHDLRKFGRKSENIVGWSSLENVREKVESEG